MSKKKIMIIIAIFIIFIAALIGIYFITTKDAELTITGTVISSGGNYVLLKADDNTEYLVKDTLDAYQKGDKIKFTYLKKSLNDQESLIEITAIKEELLTSMPKDESIDHEKEDSSLKEDNSVLNTNTTEIEEIKETNSTPNTEITNQTTTNSISPNIEQEQDPENINPPKTNNSLNTNPNNKPLAKSADEEVLAYVNSLESDVDQGITSTLKNGFITIVDFLFYDGEIAGHTFDELTTSAKLEVLKAALWVDDKVDSVFPGYKETISNGANKVYTSIKNLIVSTYLDITSSICENNSDLCASAKRDFQSLKDSFGFTWDLIKGLASSGLDKLASWYEIWSGK